MDEKKICPECQQKGSKSFVYVGVGSVTAMHCPPYYDTDGRYHTHDANIRTQDYSCSEGHSWQEKSSGSCWCGWLRDRGKVLTVGGNDA